MWRARRRSRNAPDAHTVRAAPARAASQRAVPPARSPAARGAYAEQGPGGVGRGEVSLTAEPISETEVESEFEDLGVDQPLVGIVMGSKSDMEMMQQAARELEQREILHEVRVMSAHREPDVVAEYARAARMRDLPVIGVPLSGRLSAAGGLDAILSIVQMPPGVPVACVGLDNPRNAAILAAQILVA
jgi:5-(carboxyamino)imidazole ribonucleotide mutase